MNSFDFDIYEYDVETQCRYLVGKSGENPLIVLGYRPSVGNPDNPDVFMKAAYRIMNEQGFGGL